MEGQAGLWKLPLSSMGGSKCHLRLSSNAPSLCPNPRKLVGFKYSQRVSGLWAKKGVVPF